MAGSHQSARQLHLEMLRARAAAERVDLSSALQDLSDQVAPLRKAADTIGSVGALLRGRSGTAVPVMAAVVALSRLFPRVAPWLLKAIRVAGTTLGVVLLIRRARRARRAAAGH